MVKPILYANDYSPAVRSVLLVAHAINLDLEIRSVNLMAGEHLKPDFLKMNPQHTVPTLDDNGLILWESHAIATYLVEKYAKNDTLYPKDIYVRAKIHQRLHFNSSILFTRASSCSEAIFFKNEPEFPQAGINSILSAYDFLEAFLKDDPYFAGNHITVADYCLAATISTSQFAAEIDAAKHPKLFAWFGKISSLPFYDEINGKRNELFRQFVFAKLEANRANAAAAKK